MKTVVVKVVLFVVAVVLSGQFVSAQLSRQIRRAPESLTQTAAGPKEGQTRGFRRLSDLINNPGKREATSAERWRSMDGTSTLREDQLKRGETERPDSLQNTIPYWTDSFTYQGLEFTHRMVGTDPKKGSRTTVIPTVIVPLRFVFPDGQIFDASTDLVDGQTAIQGIINSPIFQNYNFVLGGTNVGNTQYGDAFQRANFWNSVSTRSPNYHVLLGQPTVMPTQTIVVPAGLGSYYYEQSLDTIVPIVNEAFLGDQNRAIHAALNISPQTLPILVWGQVVAESSFTPGVSGAYAWHGVYYANGGIQTYIGTSYQAHTGTDPRTDVYSLSHEIVEWMDDPFGDNFTPGWNIPFLDPLERCDSGSIARGLLETGDPFEFFFDSGVELPTVSFNYHVTEAMFIDFYTRSSRSRSVNGQYSMFEIGRPYGLPTEPSSECVGSVQADETMIDVPGSLRTAAKGINNKGDVVGYYVDQLNRTRGFIWRDGAFAALDFPGSRGTVPQKINDSGDIVGYFIDNAGFPQAFSYINRRFTRIDFPGSIDGIAFGINALGEIVGAYDDVQNVTHGFKLRNRVFTSFDAPSAFGTQIIDNNDAGDFVGFKWTDLNAGRYFGFISTNGFLSPLDMPGAQFTEPFSLNNKASVAGIFDNGDGYASGFVKLFGFLHEVNRYGVPTYVYGNNNLEQIVGETYDFDTGRIVGFVGTLPLVRNSH